MTKRSEGLIRIGVVLILLLQSMGAGAAEWSTQPDQSAVTMWVSKQGAWFSGVFGEFSASVDFNPERPADGSIVGVVQTGSIDTQDRTNDAYVQGYLEVEKYPEARFESANIETTPEGYRADGTLRLVGQTKPAAFLFTFEEGAESSGEARSASLSGTMSINRFDYGIANEINVSEAGEIVIVQVELQLSQVGN